MEDELTPPLHTAGRCAMRQGQRGSKSARVCGVKKIENMLPQRKNYHGHMVDGLGVRVKGLGLYTCIKYVYTHVVAGAYSHPRHRYT